MKEKAKTTLNIRIDSELKKEAESIIDELGLSTSSAIVLFFKALIRQKGLPFDVRLEKGRKKEKTVPAFDVSKPKQTPKRRKNDKEKMTLTMMKAIERL